MRSIAAGILAAAFCIGQATPQFDVVSIKPNRSGDRGGGMRPIAGGFSASNLSVNNLIQSAYNVAIVFFMRPSVQARRFRMPD